MSDNIPVNSQADEPANQPTPATPRGGPSDVGVELDLLKDLILDEHSSLADTDSTLSGGTVTLHREIQFQMACIDRVFNSFHVPARQALTTFALQTLDHGNSNHGYHRDLAGWCQDGKMFSTREKNDLSDSILVPGKARSRSTDITGSSWYLVPEDVPCACGDDTAEDVSGAGAIFQDVTRSPLSVDEELLQI